MDCHLCKESLNCRLVQAVVDQQVDEVSRLLEAGADPCWSNESTRSTALQLAVCASNKQLIKLVVSGLLNFVATHQPHRVASVAEAIAEAVAEARVGPTSIETQNLNEVKKVSVSACPVHQETQVVGDVDVDVGGGDVNQDKKQHPCIGRIDKALAALARGEFVVVMDSEDRENEGDLIIAAEKVTAEKIAFMVNETSGIICVGVEGDRLDHLALPQMVQKNSEAHGTAFTHSIDYKKGTSTGISAGDRALTIRALTDLTVVPQDFSRPGHVFPLRARHGGVLVRPGHTEASVDLARLAGLFPAGAMCEVVNKDGTMMRAPALKQFAARHGLVMITIEDLIQYRTIKENITPETLVRLRQIAYPSHVPPSSSTSTSTVTVTQNSASPTFSFAQSSSSASSSRSSASPSSSSSSSSAHRSHHHSPMLVANSSGAVVVDAVTVLPPQLSAAH